MTEAEMTGTLSYWFEAVDVFLELIRLEDGNLDDDGTVAHKNELMSVSL